WIGGGHSPGGHLCRRCSWVCHVAAAYALSACVQAGGLCRFWHWGQRRDGDLLPPPPPRCLRGSSALATPVRDTGLHCGCVAEWICITLPWSSMFVSCVCSGPGGWRVVVMPVLKTRKSNHAPVALCPGF
ncbi:unnamed protein product, partial [Discosporangium mesarthrocarpum]